MLAVEIESQAANAAKIIFAPAFQGKTELPLEALPGPFSSKYWLTYQHNLDVVTQQLQAATAVGWELADTSTNSAGHKYLFRRPKK